MHRSLCIMALTAATVLTGCAERINPSFPITTKQANSALWEMRNNPRPISRPLVVIGGYLDPGIAAAIYTNIFTGVTRDATIITVSMGDCGSFAECRAKVIAAVDKACPSTDARWTRQVDVVGISLGGLVARCAAAESPDAKYPRRLNIARLFTVSSPQSGATAAGRFGMTDFLHDMSPDSKFLRDVAKSDAEARYELYPYVHLDDEIVGDHHAAPPGKIPYWLANTAPGSPHIAAVLDDRIWADIARRLRNEAPFTLALPAPLPAE